MTEADLDEVVTIDLDAFHPDRFQVDAISSLAAAVRSSKPKQAVPVRSSPAASNSRQLESGLESARVLREASLREELSRPFSRLVVARGDRKEILGYALSWHVVDELHLLNVAVAARARRQGIGRALMDDLLAYGRGHAIGRVLLEVRVSNAAAIALYTSLGFSRFNVRERYYDDGEDAVEMKCVLGGC